MYFLQIDGAYAAVRFPSKDVHSANQSQGDITPDEAQLMQDIRLLRKDELQVCVCAS